MDSFIVASTNDSPEIKFDTVSHQFSISGESRPENAGKFYSPVLEWLKNYEGFLYWQKHELKDKSPELNFVFKLDYFNSTSAKWLMDLLLLLKRYIDAGYKIKIVWNYEADNEDMFDAGREFALMTKLDFVFVKD